MRNKQKYNKYHKEYQLKRYHKIRQESFVLLGNCCVKCSSQNELEIDHKEWKKKSIRLNKLWSISKQKRIEELSKCQLLCRSCHLEKSKKDISEIRRDHNSKVE